MKLKFTFAMIWLAHLFTGCAKTEAPPAKTSGSKTNVSNGKTQTPQFAVLIIQLHPDGSYWKGDVGRNRSPTPPFLACGARFKPTSTRKFSLELNFSFIAHEDGKDTYKFIRSVPLPMDDVSPWEPGILTALVEDQVRFAGKPVLVFDDEYGKTLLIPRKID